MGELHEEWEDVETKRKDVDETGETQKSFGRNSKNIGKSVDH